MRAKLKKPSPAFVVACIALFVALGTPAAYAANTIFSADIANGQVKTPDLADGAVTNVKLAQDAVGSARVLNNSISSADIKGADITGGISLGAGSAANGRCVDITIGVGGSKAGEMVLFSPLGPVPAGMLLYGERVASDGTAILKVCNLTGGTAPAINDLPVRVMTFG